MRLCPLKENNLRLLPELCAASDPAGQMVSEGTERRGTKSVPSGYFGSFALEKCADVSVLLPMV